MSSQRLARLRNQNGVQNIQPRVAQNGGNNEQDDFSNVNPMQVLLWHERRLKDIKVQFENVSKRLDGVEGFLANQSQNSNEAGQLLAINDVLEKISSLSNRLEGVEVLVTNIKKDYLQFKNGDKDNRVELVVNDRVNEIRQTENVVNETKNEIAEMKETLEKLNIKPTSKDLKDDGDNSVENVEKKVTFSNETQVSSGI
tara:strand:- start:424 stop:1020 length:597 start_codon:yes stop_codon:yes gene_type:complete